MKTRNKNRSEHLLDLSEEEIDQVKQQLTEENKLVEKTKISKYDKKFSRTVTISMKLIKFFLFFGFALYALFNLAAIALSVFYRNFNAVSAVIQIVVCGAVLFLCLVVFHNPNLNLKTEKEVLYVIDDRFLFRFTNGISETPNLYYALPYEHLQSIEFTIYGTRKKQLYGRAVFTFSVANYRTKHTINSVNLTELENYFAEWFPTYKEKLSIDGKPKLCNEPPKKRKIGLCTLGCAIVSVLFFASPQLFRCENGAFLFEGVLFCVTAVVVLLAPFLHTEHLVQGLMLSSVFLSVGYGIPLFLILNSPTPFFQYLATNGLILLPTFFGNVGLCFYFYIVFSVGNKICYCIAAATRKKTLILPYRDIVSLDISRQDALGKQERRVAIRAYRETDCKTLSALFYETVHAVNAADYTREQLSAWAHDKNQLQTRQPALSSQRTLVAEINGKTVGFGSIDAAGCLDLLFVHKDFQRQGIATALCDRLEQGYSVLKTYASITAKPFFERRGYEVVREQEVFRYGIALKNYEMQKTTNRSANDQK